MNVVFRADANHNIGMGHIMRCLSIADSFKAKGHFVSFVVADDCAKSLINTRGFRVEILHSDYSDMLSELDCWPDIPIDVLIVDSYFVSYKYLTSLKKKKQFLLVYLDGRAAFPYPVDALINYNIYGQKMDYETLYEGERKPVLILGPTFTPLRSMFQGVMLKKQPQKVQNVLVSTGGADGLHLSLSLLCALEKFSNWAYRFHFLIGAMNVDKEIIYSIAHRLPFVVVHENVSDMRTLIESCDIAVSAAGSTLYEICSCGVPLITYSVADNQIPGAETFKKLSIAENVGDLRIPETIESEKIVSGKMKSDVAEVILNAVNQLSSDYEKRIKMGFRMQKLIDGFGADRIVKKIEDLVLFAKLP